MRHFVAIGIVTFVAIALMPGSGAVGTTLWSVQYVPNSDGSVSYLMAGAITPATCPGGWDLGASTISALDGTSQLRVDAFMGAQGGLVIIQDSQQNWTIEEFVYGCDHPQFAAPTAVPAADSLPIVGPWHTTGSTPFITAPAEKSATFAFPASECLRVVAEPAQPRAFASQGIAPATAVLPFTGVLSMHVAADGFSADYAAGTYIGGAGPFDLPRGFDSHFQPTGSVASPAQGPAWCGGTPDGGQVEVVTTGITGIGPAWGTWGGIAQSCASKCT